MTEPTDGFLGRWSRLKQDQTRESATADALAEAQTATPLVEPQAAEPQVAETVEVVELTDADMPDVDSLGEESDFTGFWSEQVSEGLRRKALQKLFHLPEFNIRDGLNEYDDDFTQFAPLGDTVTYQMKQFIERQKAEFQQALADEPVAEEGAVNPVAPAADPKAPAQSTVQSTDQSTASANEFDDEDQLGCCD